MGGDDVKPILCLGIGNGLRGDDGAGPAVARLVADAQIPGVTVREDRGEGLDPGSLWQGFGAVVLVDAVHSGARPGTVHRFDASGADVPTSLFGRNTHTLSLAEAIALARALGELPEICVLFGIEGERFDLGTPLSAAVAESLPRAAREVTKELENIVQSKGGSQCTKER